VLAARGGWEWRPPAWLLFAGALAPAAVGLALTAAREGRRGVGALLGRLLVWRVGPGWYAAALLLPLALAAAGFASLALATGAPARPALSPLGAIAAFAGWMLAVPLEELGWRGYALPRLQARWSALASGILLGLVWAAWHLPVLLLQPARAPGGAAAGLALFAAGVVVASLLLTWLYNGTRGSLLLTSVFHAAVNATAVALPVPPGNAVTYAVTVTLLGAVLVAALAARYGAADLGPRARVVA